MKHKERLDVLLVERGLAETRSRAQAVIMAGEVYVNGQKADKAGMDVPAEAEIEVRGSVCPYVSRGGQKLEKALREFGVEDERIFTDRQSGKDFDRPAYRRLVRRLRPGDTLTVKSIDRLGRNYREILEQWRILTHERRVGVVVLDMPLLDTRQERDLAGTLTADIVLQLLSYVAETERAFIRQRQAEGIAAARARGQTFGRPRLEVPPAFAEVYRCWNSGEMSSRAAAERLGISQPTFLRWVRETP